MGKLVRDRIPEIIRSRGGSAEVRVLGGQEFKSALLDKLLEEAGELRAASPHEQLEEAADVYEVLVAVAGSMGVTISDIAARAEAKRAERGGFESCLWLESWAP